MTEKLQENWMTPEEFAQQTTFSAQLNKADYRQTLDLVEKARALLAGSRTCSVLECADQIMRFCLLHPTSWLAGQGSYYRARVNGRDPFSRTEELWAPPPEETRLGRANLPQQPVLYLASTPDTAVHEVGATNGDVVTLVEVDSREDVNLLDLGCSERCFIDHDDFSARVPQKMHELFFLGLNRSGWRNHHAIYELLIEIYTRVVPDRATAGYELGAVLASRFLRKASISEANPDAVPIDGLLYPSVSFLRSGHCLAIRPAAYPNLEATRYLECRVVEVEMSFPFCFLAVRKIGHPSDGEIIWAAAGSDGRAGLQCFGPRMPKAPESYVQVRQEGAEIQLLRFLREPPEKGAEAAE